MMLHELINCIVFLSDDVITRNPHAIASIKPRDAAQPQSVKGVNRKKLIFYLAVQLYCTLKQ